MHKNAIFSPIRGGGRTPGTPYAASATGIGLSMLWGHYTFLTLSVRGPQNLTSSNRRQILTSKVDPRAVSIILSSLGILYFFRTFCTVPLSGIFSVDIMYNFVWFYITHPLIYM